jgi:two-component sensor histidine kinase
VQALGRAHELLMRTDWKGASLKDIVAAELEPFSERVSFSGPELTVDGPMVQTLALLLHELATNAIKYGALSDDRGRVSVAWSIVGAGCSSRFRLRWREQDGPQATPPTHKGFGSALLESAITSDLSIKPRLTYEPGGFIYELDAPLRALVLPRQDRGPAA